MTKFKDKYAALGPAPGHTRYGWMRAKGTTRTGVR